MQTVSLHDLVTIERSAEGLQVCCQGWQVPQAEGNICYRAATAVLALLDAADVGLRISMEKRIPPGGGLGGGSADASAVIRGLPQVLGRQITDLEALDLAQAVGADVPFFLMGGSALVTGIGERVEPFARGCDLHFALARPDFGIGTTWAYELYDACEVPGHRQERASDAAQSASGRVRAALEGGNLEAAAKWLANDFWGPISQARPELAKLRQAVEATGALGASLTGSGSCVFGIYEAADAAQDAAEKLSAQGYWAASCSAK